MLEFSSEGAKSYEFISRMMHYKSEGLAFAIKMYKNSTDKRMIDRMKAIAKCLENKNWKQLFNMEEDGYEGDASDIVK